MKRRSKWIKWGIGAGGTLAFAVLLNAVRTDAAFDQAYQAAGKTVPDAGAIEAGAAKTDGAFEEWKRENGARKNSSESYSEDGPASGSDSYMDRSRHRKPDDSGLQGGETSNGSGSSGGGVSNGESSGGASSGNSSKRRDSRSSHS